ncbi:MAG: hypothetical protein LBU22_12775 [Dysgonamonadaceae bacterium]|jgi:hypothetical protein|nr:hypothetical protein [Dysgonamonadaceae bacterium]
MKEWAYLVYKQIKINLKIIFAGKFIWFLLAALAFFILFMFEVVITQAEIDEGLIYGLLLFPGLLLVFYPAVFGIQNDEDARVLELIFGIPDYKYKVWGTRLLIIYLAVFCILILFSTLATILLYPVNPFALSFQLMFPVLFFGNLAFMFSTIVRNGNGTAVVMIIIGVLLLIFSEILERTYWNILLNPFSVPNNYLPVIWDALVLKNRIFLLVGSLIWAMAGLLNLQKREKFI